MRQALRTKHSPGRRRKKADRHPLFAQLFFEVRRLVAQHQRASMAERHGCLGHRAVEARRGCLSDHRVGVHVQQLAQRERRVSPAAVLDQHALGKAGRTGCVDHVSQVVRLRRIVPVLLAAFLARRRHLKINRRRRLRQAAARRLAVDQHARHAAVLQHEFEAGQRVIWIERDVDGSQLEDRHQAGDRLLRPLHAHTDPVARANAVLPEPPSDLVGASV